MSKEMSEAALAAHKKALIAEGELFRVGLMHSKINVGNALHPQVLLRGALDHAVGLAHDRVDHFLAPTGLRLQTVLPYLLTAFSFVARRKLVKPALAVGVTVALGAAWVMRRKRR